MHDQHGESLGISRRRFIGTVASLAGAGMLPAASPFAAQPHGGADGRTLVIVQLSGGVDGLNALVPYGDDAYRRARPTLALPRDRVLPLNDYVGLNDRMAPLRSLYDAGEVAIVQGVGHAGADRSHLGALAAWETASDTDRPDATGWLGRYFERTTGDPVPSEIGVAALRHRPRAFVARKAHGLILNDLPDGASALRGDPLQAVARHMRETPGTRVYYTAFGGFDTHANQAGQLDNLLGQVSDRLAAFQRTLHRDGNADRTLTLVFSEFGRRVAENASRGTDHGAAGPVLLLGAKAVPGLHGTHPSLTELYAGGLRPTVDFRCIYATILERWLGVSADVALDHRFPTLPLIA